MILRQSDEEARAAERTCSATMVATPHFGTPLASFFMSAQGRTVLRLLTMLAASEPGRATIFATSQLLRALARFDDRIGRTATLLDIVSRRLLSHVTLDPNDAIWSYIREVGADQGAIIQLTPEGMNLLNAAVVDRSHVRYASVVIAAPPPRLRELRHHRSLKHAVLYALFSLLHEIAAREYLHDPYPWPLEHQRATLAARLPFAPTTESNDGIVPTLSQIHGEIIETQLADHLDLVGQFCFQP